ncbi:putative outer membrane starch-binding protein [Dysgonomonas alginatilytica]|uniref:Putative outer membrane starch-binding protein n=1 Tax=Dysgonomonas alginatilytica TaxID=1605892 RepID=A0A2V3PJJ2_9BACT|nr:RagB/SusD family nutrient uptake outer membrane protein [Dysgonomonas alginatilytica]PXV61008.1 putative outer membrane starch-binding protein [Dysgonomonas alginatilytica]
MKSIKSIIIGILLPILFLTSCDLERHPLDEYAEDKFWTSEENAILALTGIYRTNILFNSPEYNPTDWWSYGGLIFLEFPSDNAYDRRGVNSNFYKMSAGTLLPNNDYVNNYWSNSYTKIARSNRFLEGVDQIPTSQEVRDRFKAEARFMRAAQYFYLSQFFQDVPIVTKTLTKEEANTVKKNTKAEIISFIITEFSESAKDLPRFKDLKSTETGRVSKQACLAFLGRTLLAEKEYTEATKVYEEIINYGDNSIAPDYKSIFLPAGENSSENIFSMQYLQDLAGNAMPQHAYPSKNGGWSLINVAADLFEAYQFKDGTPFSYESPLYNPNNLGENRDPRLDYTIYYDKATFKGSIYRCHPDIASPDKIASGQTTQTGLMMRKYFDENFSGNLNSYGTNIPVIRYAEILLSYLEAKLEAGDAISADLLNKTINQTRTRSSVNMPPVTELNRDKLRAILRNERRVELAMEGIRYWDLLRWEVADVALNAYIFGAPFPGAKRTSPTPDGKVDKYERWYVGNRSFRKDKDYKWPIPQREQDINPNLR